MSRIGHATAPATAHHGIAFTIGSYVAGLSRPLPKALIANFRWFTSEAIERASAPISDPGVDPPSAEEPSQAAGADQEPLVQDGGSSGGVACSALRNS